MGEGGEGGGGGPRWLVVCSDGVDVMGVREVEGSGPREGEREGWDADAIAKEMVERAHEEEESETTSPSSSSTYTLTPHRPLSSPQR